MSSYKVLTGANTVEIFFQARKINLPLFPADPADLDDPSQLLLNTLHFDITLTFIKSANTL